MIPGIDPRVDIAFRKLFGSHQSRHLTKSLINAVLHPPPWDRLAELELLNPYTEQMTLDDKLSILDIKARDDRGRLFNVEMQMVPSGSMPQRFLYYWSQLYGSQLTSGDDYSLLNPTISICFVNGRLFPGRSAYHRRFRLLEQGGAQPLTDDLDIHLLELANFRHGKDNLVQPLDFWLYFLKNAVNWDADVLPPQVDTLELREAMEVLKVFSQDEMARELYEGRLKAQRDARMRENDARRAAVALSEARKELAAVQQQRAEAEQQRAEAEQQRAEAEQQRAEAEQQRAEAEQQRAEAEQQRAEAEQQHVEVEQRARRQVARTIQLCERLLGLPSSDTDELLRSDYDALLEQAERLERQLSDR
jgi:predicted transposase/invertase (TIGR01784 family)